MEALTTTRKVGGSMMVHIPPEIVTLEGLHPDEIVRIEIKKAKQDCFGMFKGVGRFSHEDELNTHD